MPVESAAAVPVPGDKPAIEAVRYRVGGVIRDRVKPWWPAAAASAVFLTLLAVSVRRGIATNGGHLVYPVDDVYGHMAIGKNLVQHRLWGFSAMDGFSSGGSSLLWPLLLAACFALFGVHEWPPLALNVVVAVGFLFYAGWMIRRETRSGLTSFLLLLAVILFTPLPTVASSGMEHGWQILICLWFLELAVRLLSDDEPPETARRACQFLPVAAFGMTMARYEGLFLLGVVGLLLMCRRRWKTTALCAVAGGLPLGVFGAYAMSKGWRFLPNSLLLKAGASPPGSSDGFAAFVTKGYDAILANPHMAALVAGLAGALLVHWRRRDAFWRRGPLLLTMLLGGTALHLQFAGLGQFFRYESYLVGIGVLAIGLAFVAEVRLAWSEARTWLEKGGRLALLALAALLFCTPLWIRWTAARAMFAPASHNIYEQQYQMAHFLRQSYRDQGVAANDIGAIDFFANIGLVDLWGLGTMEVAQAKFDHNYTQDLVRRLLAEHDVRVVIVYAEWAAEYGGLLPEWVPVGRWTIPDNAVCGSDTVTFFAPNPALVPKLLGALRDYRARLPPGVVQTGYYCGEPLPHAQGVYAPEKDDGGTFYWTDRAAQFVLEPSAGRGDAADADATLVLSTRTLSKGVTLDVAFNGKVIASRRGEDVKVGEWVEWPIKVRWHRGDNFVNITARGGQPIISPGDARKLLVAIHEPKWTFDDRPGETHPSAPPAPIGAAR